VFSEKKRNTLEVIMARVLIVDDSKTSRKFLKNMLQEAGHEVVAEAADGEQGIEMFKEFHPDIVTMDITMPILDGIDAVSEIKKEDPAAKIIMVTAAGQKSNVVEAIKRGAADFIQKPFESSMLTHIIEKVMEE
jgi:two-component system chemotaxis response regulator CheY